VLLEKGKSIRLVTDSAFEQSGTAEQLYVDYANITRVKRGSRVYLDDGLISLLVDEIGSYFFVIYYMNG
jgi:pyruvate kinase